MEGFLSDNSMATQLRQNGSYVPAPKRKRQEFSVQDHLIALSQEKQALTLEKSKIRKSLWRIRESKQKLTRRQGSNPIIGSREMQIKSPPQAGSGR